MSREKAVKTPEVSEVEVEKKGEITGYVYCPICREVVKGQGRYAHFSNSHPKEDYEKYKDKFEEAPAPEQPRETKREGRRYEDPYDQMVDEMAKKLHRELLKTPNVSDEKAGAIVDDFREDRVLQGSAKELYYVIMDYCPKAKPGLLGRVLDRVFSIQDEYSQLLSRVEPPPVREKSRLREEIPHLRRTDRRRYGDLYEDDYDEQSYIARQRFRREQAEDRRQEEEHQLRMKRLEAEILKITRETGGSAGPQGSFAEVREFIDGEGKVCDPEKAVSVRVKRTPVEPKGGLTSEEVRKIIREEREQLTPEMVREIVRSEGTQEKPLTSEGVEKIVRQVIEEKQKLTPEKVRDIIKSEMRVPASGTMTPEGVLATAIQEAGRVVGQREPVKVIIEGAKDLFIPPGMSGTMPPPSHSQPPQHSPRLIEELRKRGLVTRVVERVTPGNGSSSNPRSSTLKEPRIISKHSRPKEPVGETEPLRGKTGTNTYIEDDLGVVT